MEIQTTNQKELATKEWTPLQNGNSVGVKILEAKKEMLIKFCSDEELKQVLRYAMILVGLRGKNLPTDEEKFVLINFVKTNFVHLSLAEIHLAFELAVSGKFAVEVKCYENFSCEYFARIVNAYIDFSRAETRNILKIEPTIQAKPCNSVLKKQSIETANMYQEQITKAQKEKVHFNWIAGGLHVLYDYLVQFGIYSPSIEEKQKIASKFKNLKGEELIVACKAEAYKDFIQNMVTFGVKLDEYGEIKPCEE
jgi:hypothetical protein